MLGQRVPEAVEVESFDVGLGRHVGAPGKLQAYNMPAGVSGVFGERRFVGELGAGGVRSSRTSPGVGTRGRRQLRSLNQIGERAL